MKLPRFERAIIPLEKILRYLLNPDHPTGGAKAVFFRRMGFAAAQSETFIAALREHVRLHDVARIETERFGVVYIVEGSLQTPRGSTNVTVRSVWLMTNDESLPRLVSAYPIGRLV